MSVAFQYAPNIIVAGGNQYLSPQSYALYERGTLDALYEIMKHNWTGYGIIQSIAEMSGKQVIITPNFTKNCNASAGLPSWKANNQVEIVYSPIPFGKSGCASPGFTPDEVLLHELVHAYRQLKRGIIIAKSISIPNYKYDNVEEFTAILLTNIYASKKKKVNLRKDHGATTLLPALSQSDTFMKREPGHARHIQDLVVAEYYLCSTFVRKDDGVFNPVDYFLKNSVECIKLIPGEMIPDK